MRRLGFTVEKILEPTTFRDHWLFESAYLEGCVLFKRIPKLSSRNSHYLFSKVNLMSVFDYYLVKLLIFLARNMRSLKRGPQADVRNNSQFANMSAKGLKHINRYLVTMKKPLTFTHRLTLALALMCVFHTCSNQSLWGQGQVVFSNHADSAIFHAEKGLYLESGDLAQLWVQSPDGSWVSVNEPVRFLAAGIFFGGSVTIEGIWGGASATMKVVAWEGPATSLEQAQSMGLAWGQSPAFTQLLGGPRFEGDLPPGVPAQLSGMTGFEIRTHVPTITHHRVWEDTNVNGIWDSDEPALQGIPIAILLCSDHQVVAQVLSNEFGQFNVPEEITEDHYLQILPPDGWAISPWDHSQEGGLTNQADPLTGASPCISSACPDDGSLWCADQSMHLGLFELKDPSDPVPDIETPALGVATASWWKRHPKSWPITEFTLGGFTYTQDEARALMSNGKDKSLTMFAEVVATTLNLAYGTSDACIASVLEEALAWMQPIGAIPAGVEASSQTWKSGKALYLQLKEYNQGDLCVTRRAESLSPMEMSVGFADRKKGDHGFRIRIIGEPGRNLVIQRTFDFVTWEEVATLDNPYGIKEVIADQSDQHPSATFRIMPIKGPARKGSPKQHAKGAFRQVGQGESVQLQPIVYEGDLVIAGQGNQVTGQSLSADQYTVVAGNVEIRGNGNTLGNLTVLGNITFRGNNNTLENVDYQGDVIETGKGPNIF